MLKILLTISTLMMCSSISEEFKNFLVIWNVGQGLWVTASYDDHCDHFDMGGEKASWKKLIKLCGRKSNFAHFSHWDSDHIGFVERGARELSNFCVAQTPGGQGSSSKVAKFSRLKKCFTQQREVSELHFASKSTSTNDSSRIYVSQQTLMPGDSPQKMEKIWLQKLPEKIRILILGHHGSRTSTSEKLLKTLSNLKLAIASARKRRYGHPHKEVLQHLKSFGVSELNTEDWNNIFIELN